MCEKCGYNDVLETLDEMLASGQYDWATDFLESVNDYIVEKDHVSEKQKAAVLKIKERKQYGKKK